MTPKEAALALAEASRAMKALDVQYPAAARDLRRLHEPHPARALKLVGVDHVGVGADWDGGGGVKGMEDCAGVWQITERLLKEGYRPDDLQKIWGGKCAAGAEGGGGCAGQAPCYAGPAGGGE